MTNLKERFFAPASSGLRMTLFVILLMSSVAFADEETQKFPFIGKVKADNVNIRAGADQNFEILAKANSGNLLCIDAEAYGWYKVRLPKSAHCFVAKGFVDKDGSQAVSKASNLNLRARPDKESSVVGQLKKGDTADIASEELQDWYEILPPRGCYGWVRSDLLEFYSYNLQDIEPKKIVEIQSPAPVAQGEVQNLGFTFRKKPGSHKLVSKGKIAYYLKSGKYNLKNFEGRVVSVWGDIQDIGSGRLLIDVTEIKTCE